MVHTIGKLSETFSYRYMWKNFIEEDAAVFSSVLESTGESFILPPMFTASEAYHYWWFRHGEVKGDAKNYADVKEREYQDFSRAFHIYTKRHLVGLDDPDDALGRHNYELLEKCKTVDDLRKLPFFRNLVIVEHLRNVASHECLGYSPMINDEYKSLGGVEIDTSRHKLLTMVSWDEVSGLPETSYLNSLERVVAASLNIAINYYDKNDDN